MTMRLMIVASLLCVLATPTLAAEKASAKAEPFEEVSVRFEQNATDGDVEAVFEAIGSDEGLAKLTLSAPDGHAVVELTSPGKSALGIREFHFESPEPTDVAALKKAYPEGQYTFTATTSSGEKLEGKSTLSHKLPAPTSFVSPKADARNVSARNLKITWAPVKGVAGYTLEISPAKTSAHIDVKLPPSTTSFIVPDGVLVPGAECQLGIGTVSSSGNVSVIETTFKTAAGK